ncbi:hypothetical protein [Bradyrhizobium sp. S3.12.5]|uniref:hypothetical protein n=1 Tax=Bradyrhizobium sp. S3.12.5 TaxID=3156386 RepID=UPI00339499FF
MAVSGLSVPLGVPALEDKIVQSAVAEVLSAIYEADFLGSLTASGRAGILRWRLIALHTAIMSQHVNWVLDAEPDHNRKCRYRRALWA